MVYNTNENINTVDGLIKITDDIKEEDKKITILYWKEMEKDYENIKEADMN